MPNTSEQTIIKLKHELSDLETYILELEKELNKLDSYLTVLELNYSADLESLEIELEKSDNKIIDLEYELFLEKTKDSKHKFYWFTGKTRPPAHVVYSNSETQLFGFNEPPQYKFIEHHDLRFITNCSLDDLIEQF